MRRLAALCVIAACACSPGADPAPDEPTSADEKALSASALPAGKLADRARDLGRLEQPTPLFGPPPPDLAAAYHTPEEVEAILDATVAGFPEIAAKHDLSGPLFEGHRVLALKVSDHVALDEDEPTFLLEAGIQGSEPMGPEVALDVIEQLTTLYGSDPEIARLVDSMEIWIVPQASPDGAAHALSTEQWWLANRNPAGAVEINRDFPRVPARHCAPKVGGEQPETQALMRLITELRPMYYLAYHGAGYFIQWSTHCGRTAEEDLHREVAEELSRLNSQELVDFIFEPGTSFAYAYGASGALGFTINIGRQSWPPYSERDGLVEKERPAWRHLMARTLDGPSVVGHVRDARTGLPIAATFRPAFSTFPEGQVFGHADKQGRFGRALQAGTDLALAFEAPGYRVKVVPVHVDHGPTVLDVALAENLPPVVALACPAQVNEFTELVLGESIHDPDGDALTFAWTQLSGPAIRPFDVNDPVQRFRAPAVSQDSAVEVRVQVSDGYTSTTAEARLVVADRWAEHSVGASSRAIPVPDDEGEATDSIEVADVGVLLRGKARLNLAHPSPSQLRVVLAPPSGRRLVLFDRAARPEEASLDALRGESIQGAWTLSVSDVVSGETGSLVGWSLDLEPAQPCDSPADCALPFAGDQSCARGGCELVACQEGRADCDARVSNGCEADLAASATCGSCGVQCPRDAQCLEGECRECVPETPNGIDDDCDGETDERLDCGPGWADCNGLPSDGCEADLDRADTCGGCEVRCAPGLTCFQRRCRECAAETINGRDDDCDGAVDERTPPVSGCGCAVPGEGGLALLGMMALLALARRPVAGGRR